MAKQPNAVTVRAASGNDVASILRLADICKLSYWAEKDLHTEIAHKDSIVLSALDRNGELIGFILGRLILSTGGRETNEAEIYNIGVVPEYHRAGIGSKLFEKFIKKCRAANVQSIWLEVRKSNFVAIEFYRSRGFEANYERASYYRDPTEDAIVMKSTI